MRVPGAAFLRRFAGMSLVLVLGSGQSTGQSVSLAEERIVVARVGDQEITATQIRARFRQLAAFQRLELGPTWQEQRLALVEKILAPEARLLLQGKQNVPGYSPALLLRLRDAERRALSEATRAELRRKAKLQTLSSAQIDKYYQIHLRHFQQPRAHLLWRILVGTRTKAQTLLREIKLKSGRTWRQIARAESLDEATNMRSGTLGYVQSNGYTHRPQVRVDPALFVAADALTQAGVVPKPVIEGNYFAVVWRRATRRAKTAFQEDVLSSIRHLVTERRQGLAVGELLGNLRKSHLKAYQPQILARQSSAYWGQLGVSGNRWRIQTRRQPGAPNHSSSEHPLIIPTKTPRGLR